METTAQKSLRIVTNINWFIFGAVFLTGGLYVIYGAAIWAWLGFGLWYLFGLGSAAVWGAKAIVEREES
jgi:hypothetical protein